MGSAVVAPGLQSSGSTAVVHGASLLLGTSTLPGPGNEPVSPAPAGGLFTTEPPGKPSKAFFFFFGEVIAIHKFHFSLVQILLVAFVLCVYALLHCRRWCVNRCECVCTASVKIVCILVWVQFTSVEFSRSVVSDSLRPHGLRLARPPCPSPTPRVCPNLCPLSR